jgi:hypothetical protein
VIAITTDCVKVHFLITKNLAGERAGMVDQKGVGDGLLDALSSSNEGIGYSRAIFTFSRTH